LPNCWRAYDHHDHLPDQAKALVAWMHRLAGLIGSEFSSGIDPSSKRVRAG